MAEQQWWGTERGRVGSIEKQERMDSWVMMELWWYWGSIFLMKQEAWSDIVYLSPFVILLFKKKKKMAWKSDIQNLPFIYTANHSFLPFFLHLIVSCTFSSHPGARTEICGVLTNERGYFPTTLRPRRLTWAHAFWIIVEGKLGPCCSAASQQMKKKKTMLRWTFSILYSCIWTWISSQPKYMVAESPMMHW